MGISITVYTLSDDELRLLRDDLSVPATRLAHITSGTASAYLNGYWPTLHTILTTDSSSHNLPQALLMAGDVDLPHIENGAHGIYAATNRQLTELLASISEEQVRQYVKAHETRFITPQTVSSGQGLSEAAVRQLTAEFWLYLTKLRQVSRSAADAGCGLLLVRWEDW